MSGAGRLADYPYSIELATRWSDNDVYGHVNNVTYYSYFDTVANHFLVHEGGLDIAAGPVIGLVVESSCQYHAPLAFPQVLRAGLRVDRLGNRVENLDRHFHQAAKDVSEIKISADKGGRRAKRLDNFDFEELAPETEPTIVKLTKPDG